MIRIGRWRIDVEVWRAPRARRRRVVLWGARRGDVQVGSRAHREMRLHQSMMAEMIGLRRLMARSNHYDHVHFADVNTVIVEAGSTVSLVDDDLQPLWKGSRLGPEVDRLWREVPAAERPAHGGYPS